MTGIRNKPKKKHSAPAIAVLIFVLIAAAGRLPAAPQGLNRFINLPAGSAFHIHLLESGKINPSRAGEGKVIERSANALSVEFYFSQGPDSGGTIRLQRTGSGNKLKLTYNGKAAGTQQNRTEIVEPDPLLLSAGILKFRFDSNKRFFQISVNRKNRTVLVTEFGSVALIRK